jgi:SAM-dependent methyltransferase
MMHSPSELDSEIQFITSEFSPGVGRENEATAGPAESYLPIISSCRSPEEFYGNGYSTAPGEYEFLLKRVAKNLKILDIGVGPGQSSVFLAASGHRVWAVEPGKGFCRCLAQLKKQFDLNLVPVCGVGEEIDKIPERDFDAVFFNSSLHHCDDPVLALRKALAVLRPGGFLFLSSENIIRPWVSKKRWYRRLETHAVQMGHYGGNEHTYFTWEYERMLRQAGFSKIKRIPSNLILHPLHRIGFDFKVRNGLTLPKMRERDFLVRVPYYFALSWVARNPVLFRLLSKCSIFPCQFMGIKPAQ